MLEPALNNPKMMNEKIYHKVLSYTIDLQKVLICQVRVGNTTNSLIKLNIHQKLQRLNFNRHERVLRTTNCVHYETTKTELLEVTSVDSEEWICCVVVCDDWIVSLVVRFVFRLCQIIFFRIDLNGICNSKSLNQIKQC